MFELTISKQILLPALLAVANAVDKKQVRPVLSNILVRLTESDLILTATDLDIEITSRLVCQSSQGTGVITVPAKKMMDIIRSLDEDAIPTISFHEGVVSIVEGRSRFKVATLPADDYPKSDEACNQAEFSVQRSALLHVLQTTCFAMSQQDVRAYLNGLLLEVDAKTMTTVATDGHRMAISRLPCPLNTEHGRLLIPRKGVNEIIRLLNAVTDEVVLLSFSLRHVKLTTQEFQLLSKLIEARFPSYTKAIPTGQDKELIVSRDVLKRVLSRIVILAHEKSKAVLLHIQDGLLTIVANNHDQEEAVETISAETKGLELKIGINANYLLDVLNHLQEGLVCLSFGNEDTSILVRSVDDDSYSYILMPMKI